MKPTDEAYENYWKKYPDGTLWLLEKLTEHDSPYLKAGKEYESLEEALFPVANIDDHLARMTLTRVRHCSPESSGMAERAPAGRHVDINFANAETRNVALHVAGPPWRFREAYEEARHDFRGAGLGEEAIEYNLGWLVGLIRNYSRSLTLRHERLYGAKNWLAGTAFSLVLTAGAFGACVGLAHLTADQWQDVLARFIPEVRSHVQDFRALPWPELAAMAGRWAPGLLVVEGLFAVAVFFLTQMVETKHAALYGGFSGNAKDAAQKRRNAIEAVLTENSLTEADLLRATDKANQSGWRHGAIRLGADQREFLIPAAQRVGRFCRVLEEQTQSGNRAAEMTYAGLSAYAHYDSLYVFRWGRLWSKARNRVLRKWLFGGITAVSAAMTANAALIQSNVAMGVLAAASVGLFLAYLIPTRRFETLLTTPDPHKDFVNLVHRATPANLGVFGARSEKGRTNLGVSDALDNAMKGPPWPGDKPPCPAL